MLTVFSQATLIAMWPTCFCRLRCIQWVQVHLHVVAAYCIGLPYNQLYKPLWQWSWLDRIRARKYRTEGKVPILWSKKCPSSATWQYRCISQGKFSSCFGNLISIGSSCHVGKWHRHTALYNPKLQPDSIGTGKKFTNYHLASGSASTSFAFSHAINKCMQWRR